jgi:endonuclease YncB( thermonuclease family)
MFIKLSILITFLIFNVSALAQEMIVDRVIDGDTVSMLTVDDNKIMCRLAYVDTPESKLNAKTKKDSIRCNETTESIISAGKMAKQFTQSYLTMYPTQDVKILSMDIYGRSVCKIGKLNEELISNGYAVPYLTYIVKKERGYYIELSNHAKSNLFGIWYFNYSLMECMSTK